MLICDGRTFIAGADISEFGKPPQGATLPDVQDAIEGSAEAGDRGDPRHGARRRLRSRAGLPLPRRRAVARSVGLPEVKLGLMPGAGGTQRLPRMSGVEKALELILSGNAVRRQAGARMGLVDELVEEGKLREGALAFARKVDRHENAAAQGARPQRQDRSRARPPGDLRQVPQGQRPQVPRLRSPEGGIRAVEAAVDLPFDEGMKRERAAVHRTSCRRTQSRAQRYVFFAERKVWKIADVPDDTPTLPIKKVGVIGAGTMGGGIVDEFPQRRHSGDDRRDRSRRRSTAASPPSAATTRTRAKKGRLTQADVETRMGLLSPALDLDALADCDLVIEAVFENMDIKKEVFRKLDTIAKPGAILATNTSYLEHRRDRLGHQAAGARASACTSSRRPT